MERAVGKKASGGVLTENEIRGICAEALSQLPLDGDRVLVLIPDHTRHAPVGLFFRVIVDLIGSRVRMLDFMVATGTHQPMSRERLLQHVGITEEEAAASFARVRFFNHAHDDPKQLVCIGSIPAAEMSSLSGGLYNEDVHITLNNRILEYDRILIVSPVVPHETVGFSGGNKYFVPGIAGREIVETIHWIGALITNPAVNGVKDTPVRRVIDRAVSLLPVPRTAFCFAVENHGLACLFAGAPEDAWSQAADCSAGLHVRYVETPYRRIIGIAPPIYEEMWVAGKVMYKLEPVVADGGELVIYGPHIRTVSFVHGEAIARVGYHTRDYFLKQWDRFSGAPKLILAHSTNVRGIGTYENGVERPRIRVTLATSISEEECGSINLGFCDYRTIEEECRRGKAEECLVVENAGQVLYRLHNHQS